MCQARHTTPTNFFLYSVCCPQPVSQRNVVVVLEICCLPGYVLNTRRRFSSGPREWCGHGVGSVKCFRANSAHEVYLQRPRRRRWTRTNFPISEHALPLRTLYLYPGMDLERFRWGGGATARGLTGHSVTVPP